MQSRYPAAILLLFFATFANASPKIELHCIVRSGVGEESERNEVRIVKSGKVRFANLEIIEGEASRYSSSIQVEYTTPAGVPTYTGQNFELILSTNGPPTRSGRIRAKLTAPDERGHATQFLTFCSGKDH